MCSGHFGESPPICGDDVRFILLSNDEKEFVALIGVLLKNEDEKLGRPQLQKISQATVFSNCLVHFRIHVHAWHMITVLIKSFDMAIITPP